MKITKKELSKIIKEEAERFVKTKALESRKEEIQQQLNEMFAEDDDLMVKPCGCVEDCDCHVDEVVSEESIEDVLGDEITADETGFSDEFDIEEGLFGPGAKEKEAAKAELKNAIQLAINQAPISQDQKAALFGKVDQTVNTAGQKYDYKAVPRIQKSSRGELIITLKPAGPSTKLGKAVANIATGAGHAVRNEALNESDIKNIVKEEAERLSKVKELQEQAKSIVDELEEISSSKKKA